MIANKEQISEFCQERIKAKTYEWYITDDYLYLGVTEGQMLFNQSFFDDLKNIFEWQFTIIGNNFCVLSQGAMGIEARYMSNSELKASLQNKN